MAKSKRSIPEINAGSMADIAFLLLIFFLITTTMANDQGILNILPPKIVGEPPVIKERNVLKILVNANDQILVEDKIYMNLDDLAEYTEKFIMNNGVDENLSVSPAAAVISLKNDRGTSYNAYIKVQNELRKAFNKLRNQLSQDRYGANFDALPESKQDKIIEALPQRISEAEPDNVGGDL